MFFFCPCRSWDGLHHGSLSACSANIRFHSFLCVGLKIEFCLDSCLLSYSTYASARSPPLRPGIGRRISFPELIADAVKNFSMFARKIVIQRMKKNEEEEDRLNGVNTMDRVKELCLNI